MKKALFSIIWFSIGATAIGSIHSNHFVTWEPIDSLVSTEDSQKWSLQHVLAQDCRCSQTVSQYLLKRGPQADVVERVTWIGDGSSPVVQQLESRGYVVQVVRAAAAQLDLPAGVPFLAIRSAKNEGVYVGGYASHKVNNEADIQDLAILGNLRDGKQMSSFPIYGCTVSQNYRAQMDPFGFKYKKGRL